LGDEQAILLLWVANAYGHPLYGLLSQPGSQHSYAILPPFQIVAHLIFLTLNLTTRLIKKIVQTFQI